MPHDVFLVVPRTGVELRETPLIFKDFPSFAQPSVGFSWGAAGKACGPGLIVQFRQPASSVPCGHKKPASASEDTRRAMLGVFPPNPGVLKLSKSTELDFDGVPCSTGDRTNFESPGFGAPPPIPLPCFTLSGAADQTALPSPSNIGAGADLRLIPLLRRQRWTHWQVKRPISLGIPDI
jgi:hypothetical protein